jgi:two-component system, NtrC family, nitrogen regulation sensor histidine kinase NtrY
VTLAQRILLAILLVGALLTVGLSLALQRAWRTAEERQFQADFSQATARLQAQLEQELVELPKILGPLCDHGQIVDDPLTSLAAGGIPTDRRFALSALNEATRKAYGFDELVLFTSSGEILGAKQKSLIGTTDPELAQLIKAPASARVERLPDTARMVAHCAKRQGAWGVGMRATRLLGPTLAAIGRTHGLTISVSAPDNAGPRSVFELQGLTLFAQPRTSHLNRVIQDLTRTIWLWGGLFLLTAIPLGLLFARRLARPIEELARQAQLVLGGDPRRVDGRAGGKELQALAAAFNTAIEDLTALRKRLATTERIAAQRDIARRVAHEIKNPLAPIRAAMETLRRLRRRDDPAFAAYFEEATSIVLAEVARIATIVDEFTRFARMPSPKFADIDPQGMLRDVVRLHQSSRTKLVLSAESLGQVRADRDQLVQVMTNLLQNAIAAVDGVEHPRVDITARRQQQQLEIEVRDNGKGVPEELRPRLFRPYVTSKAGGTGLGLAIVQRIVVEHGGSIDYNPVRGGGARFTIRIPVRGPSHPTSHDSDEPSLQ